MDYRREVSRELAKRRDDSQIQQKQRLERVYKTIPEIREIDRKLKQLGVALARAIVDRQDIGAIEEETTRLKMRRSALLSRQGLPENYTDTQYTCPHCQDTGVVNGRNCHCKEQLLTSKAYEMSSIEGLLERENFSAFDLGLFRGNRLANEDNSPRENMAIVAQQAKHYAKTFKGRYSDNLMFYGSVGTGKTFLCNAIAKAVLDKGYGVLYQTAPKLLDFLGDYSFLPAVEKIKHQETYHRLFNVDLLILDDLGTEFTTSVSVSGLFELLNERIIRQKPIIISTNLAITDLPERYDQRIFSRIIGEFRLFNIYGDDLRIRKLGL